MDSQKSHVWKFLKVSVLAIIGVIAIDYFLIPMLLKLAITKIDFNYFCYNKSNVLVLGDSHTRDILRGEISKKLNVQNLSGPGHYSSINFYQYKEYRTVNPAPRYVILGTNFWMFSNKSNLMRFTSFKNTDFRKEYLEELFSSPQDYFRSFKNLKMNAVKHSSFLAEDMWRFSFRAFKKENTCLSENDSIFEKSELARAKTLSKMERPEKFLVQNYESEGFSYKELSNSIEVKYFVKLLEEFRKDNVRVLLLETPEFIGSTESLSGRELFYNELNELLSDFPNAKFIKHDSFDLDEANHLNFYDGGWGVTNSHLSYVAIQYINKQIYERYLADASSNAEITVQLERSQGKSNK